MGHYLHETRRLLDGHADQDLAQAIRDLIEASQSIGYHGEHFEDSSGDDWNPARQQCDAVCRILNHGQ